MTRDERAARADQRLLARLANLGDPEPPPELFESVMREVALRRLGSTREIAWILALPAVALATALALVPAAPLLSEWVSAMERVVTLGRVGATVVGALLSGPPSLAFSLSVLALIVTLLGLKGALR